MLQAIAIIFQVFGGLGIFLLGMKYMSDGMQAVAGMQLKTPGAFFGGLLVPLETKFNKGGMSALRTLLCERKRLKILV